MNRVRSALQVIDSMQNSRSWNHTGNPDRMGNPFHRGIW